MANWWWKEEYKFSADVYIVQNVKQPKFYKIGATNNFKRRFKELRRDYGFLFPIRVFWGAGTGFEKVLHKKFESKRTWLGDCYEWFMLDKNDLTEIKGMDNPRDARMGLL